MGTSLQETANDGKKPLLIFYPVFIVFTFLFTWLFVKPSLIYQHQEPVFFFNERFFVEHLTYPGGLTTWLGSFLGQSLFFDGLGAFALTCLSGLIALSVYGVVRAAGSKGKILWPMLSVLAFFVLQNRYDFTMPLALGFLLAVGFAAIYMHWFPQKGWFRLGLLLVLGTGLYFVLGGPFLLFVLLVALYDLLVSRRIWTALAAIALGVGLPLAGFYWIFFVNLKAASLYLLPLSDISGLTRTILIALYLYLPVFMIVHSLLSFLFKGKSWMPSSWFANRPWVYLASCFLFLGIGATVLGTQTVDQKQKRYLQIRNYAQNHQWRRILDISTPKDLEDWRSATQINQALYHVGGMADNLFVYPQYWGSRGLVMDKSVGLHYPLENSDLYLDIGHLNEAEHWGHESMSTRGETGWTLEQLAIINLAKDEADAANVFISKLERTVLFKSRAAHLRQLLEDASLRVRDPEISAIRAHKISPEGDFIYYSSYPTVTFDRVLENSTKNRMAFEYLMSMYLLNGELSDFIKHLKYLNVMGYTEIPRPYQEAIILYMAAARLNQMPLPKGFTVSPELVKQFQRFQTIWSQSNHDPVVALSKLRNDFRDTYWFYLKFYKPKE